MKIFNLFILLLLISLLMSSFYLKDDKLTISNVNKQNYKAEYSLTRRIKPYIDRKNIMISSMPSFLLDAIIIKTANEDKISKGNDFLTFNVNRGVKVFVAHWDLIKTKPSWLTKEFVNTGLKIVTDDTYSLYKKDFPSGKVSLGGNIESENEEDIAMYYVFITNQMSLPVNTMYAPSFEYHLSLLNKYSNYQAISKHTVPDFFYQSKNDTSLQKLKQKFELNKIAGNGDDISQITNLMKWVNTRIKHNGSNSTVKNSCSLNIIEYNDKTGKGVNCRMVSTVLNDAYLALGFKARIVSCLPNENYDTENHVTNLVYSKFLKKWIYMDPSFGAYVTDKKGILLNHGEIRKALILGDSLIVNGLIHNGEHYRGGQKSYFEYMSKNLFRFSCPLYSQYGYETNGSELIYINLNPLGYKENELKYNIRTKNNEEEIYYTHDDILFWAKP